MESSTAPESRLAALRDLMVANGLDCYVVLHTDPHQSEYLAACFERVAFMSGFTGTNGTCVVTKDKALMYTDGRYYLQAEKQLLEGWELVKMSEPGTKTYFEWIKANVRKGSTIGMDSKQMPVTAYENRAKYFEEASLTLKCPDNLVDKVQGTPPALPTEKVWILSDTYTGESAQSKLTKIADKLPKGTQFLLATTLDDIAWMLNLRGNDISFNPLFFSYLLLEKNNEGCRVKLFIDETKVASPELQEYLSSNNITIMAYDQVTSALSSIEQPATISIDKKKCNYHMYQEVTSLGLDTVDNDGCIALLKCKKTLVQQEGMRQCNIRDCAAIMKYFAFLEEELRKEDHGLDEFSGARKVEAYRAECELFKGPSFDTISSIGPNGAVIHYKPKKDSAMPLNNDEIYLLDSGGQYLDGTTDITRTAHFGGKAPTAFQKEAYTRVLLGCLDVEKQVWPENATYSGGDFDILARRHLFAVGLNYKHGTGHGVGSMLNVHEGPIGISRPYKIKFEPGMCVSDEPGYYHDGEFGIRIENVIMVQTHPTYKNSLCFENLTVAPYSRELIDKAVLGEQMEKYVNEFHAKCLEKLTPHLQNDARAMDYVKRACAPL